MDLSISFFRKFFEELLKLLFSGCGRHQLDLADEERWEWKTQKQIPRFGCLR